MATLPEMLNNEPVASTLVLIWLSYMFLKLTGLWYWLPNKIYGVKRQ